MTTITSILAVTAMVAGCLPPEDNAAQRLYLVTEMSRICVPETIVVRRAANGDLISATCMAATIEGVPLHGVRASLVVCAKP